MSEPVEQHLLGLTLQKPVGEPWRLYGHGRLECSCGSVLVQCRCPDHKGTIVVVPNGCPRCQKEA